ncbi:hypothetical protein [Caballeronia sp.]|uniref:hypothetical protein n=1 Tax=Caballeronia sp. TaxID=1931223 RepID=UPI003C4E1AD4
MKSNRLRLKYALCGALFLACGFVVLGALAQAGGQPLVLDTQTGIHGGSAGTVLQTGPLTGSGMVQARTLATLPELPQNQQTIVVSPYIEVQPGGQSHGSTTAARSRLSAASRYQPRSAPSHSTIAYDAQGANQTHIATRQAAQTRGTAPAAASSVPIPAGWSSDTRSPSGSDKKPPA